MGVQKKALITGISGQDGHYLSELLLAKGYAVFGLARTTANLQHVSSGVKMLVGDLEDHDSLRSAVRKIVPDEVYNLAGIADLKTAYAFPEKTLELNCRSVGVLLNESLAVNPSVRFLQASSSEIFLPSPTSLNEKSLRYWNTDNPYAKAKMLADRDVIEAARSTRGTFACSAILFNHESPYRPEKYVTRKIARNLVKIKFGMEECMYLGNLDTRRDWGFAGDFVEAMWRMLQLDTPEDFIVATGKIHSIRDVVALVCGILKIDISWEGEGVESVVRDATGKVIVRVDPVFYKPDEQYPKFGNIEKAEKLIGWKPKVDFDTLIKMMVERDLAELQPSGK